MSGDMSMGRVVGVARVGDPSRELERVVVVDLRPQLRVLHFHLRKAALELRDAGAERLDLGLAVGVALANDKFVSHDFHHASQKLSPSVVSRNSFPDGSTRLPVSCFWQDSFSRLAVCKTLASSKKSLS